MSLNAKARPPVTKQKRLQVTHQLEVNGYMKVFCGQTHPRTGHSNLLQPEDCGVQRHSNDQGQTASFGQTCHRV